jgi:hypothetical protein
MGLPFPNGPTAFQILLETEADHKVGLIFVLTSGCPAVQRGSGNTTSKYGRNFFVLEPMRLGIPKLGTFLLPAIIVLLCGIPVAAGDKQDAKLPANANDLVRTAVQNEVKPSSSSNTEFHSWKMRQVKPARTTVRQFVETPDGLIARLITINDKPLSNEERTKEEARINRLLDPKQMQAKRKQQNEDESRSRRMVAALPDAFIYQYAGTEEKNGHTLVNLKFTPNPQFSPPTREALVYQGMQGTMTIDATAMRMAKIDGTMMKDVSIGWGIIGHLDKGGQFIVEQTEVDKGDWEVTKMRLNFTGKALIFKSIRIDETDVSDDFQKVPKMTVAQALDYLKKAEQGGTVADKANFK